MSPYLHVCVVRWGEGLIYWCWTVPLTAVGVVPFGIDNPLTPADLVKVDPHVHLPAERTLLLLCGAACGSSSDPSPSLLLGFVVPLGPAGPGAVPVQADVLGVLSRADERWHSLAAWVLPREDHHHDPVRCMVLDSILLPLFLLLPLLHLRLLRPQSGVLPPQPATEHLCHVEHPPGGWGDHRTGMSSQAAQQQPVLWAVHAGAVVPVGVVDVHRGSGGLGESRQADAKLSQLDVVACRHGGHVKGDGPPLAILMAA